MTQFKIVKRYAIPSVILLISIFLPWFSVNMFIDKMSVAGYRLGFATIILILFALCGIAIGIIRSSKIRNLVGAVIGLLTIIFVWVANQVFYAKISSSVGGLLGSSTSRALSSAVGSRSFGFYLAFIMGVVLLVVGAYSFLTENNGSVTVPDISNIKVPKIAVPKISIPWQQLQKVRLGGKKFKYIASGAGVVVLYLVAMWVFDATHSATATVKSFVAAVRAGDTGRVSSMLDQTHASFPSWDVKGFVTYYDANDSALENLLAPLVSNDSSDSSALQSVFGNSGGNGVYLTPHNILGFRTYKIHLPSVPYSLTAPSGAAFAVNGSTVGATGNLLPAQYTIQATIKTPFGPVTDSQSVDATSGTAVNQSFDFSNDMLTISSQDLSGKVSLSIDNHNLGTVTLDSNNGNSAQIGPFPLQNIKQVVVTASEPWGTYTESGAVDNGQVQLQSDPNANLSVAQALAQVILDFEKQDAADQVSGNYQPELKYLAQDGNEYSSISSQNSPSGNKLTLQNVNFSPSVQPTTLQNGQIGLNIEDSEFYVNNGNNQENDCVYTMEYVPSSQQWLIYNIQSSGQQIGASAPDFQLK